MTPTAGQRLHELLNRRADINQCIRRLIKHECSGEGHRSFNVVSNGMGWTCKSSPVGVCVYNDLDDPAHDECLYCHDPEERK